MECQLNSVVLNEASGYNLQWVIFNNDTITFQVSVNKNAWVALGWHCKGCSSDGAMENADYNIATFDSNGNGVVWDCVNPDGTPMNDTDAGFTNDIISYSAYQTSGYSIMIFSKKLSTGDKGGDRILYDGPTDFIWAHGESNGFGDHGVGNSGRVTVDLSKGQIVASEGIDYVDWHASFMCVAFGLLMPFSIFSARFLKVFMWWWPIHYVCNGLASICAIIGFGMALKMVGGFDFSTTHSIFGIITLCLVVVSILFGVLSHFLWKPTREKTPIFPDILHWFIGRITFALSIASIITGMVLRQVPTPVIIVFSGIIGFYFSIVALIEIYKKVYPNYLDTSHEPTPSSYSKINYYSN
ncbi:hypothetical protein DICPUDRAFT_147581 [Dictyostelium purpureum]|uniref:Cytochrome b561 domain-containing protein n=1 Tax=Dictyostelium purpureum TaxID=5786 RepID=F0Z8V6_DICPU|nr:uncharacterized protein DICPUDRAFT_147581 [Dictyostelium purpureum]EGC39611.1 hypothetical protein DICPUDRAFT_147581 [Dictyostelium purpureum]|eukprot:XP_003283832.1 hypothetical protein DICPUDRAFT_147581 [Dictyostelium purpureum]